MGGSLGMAAGEAIVRGLELALEKKSPFIVFAASGGARMQEGILSLMQMPRTTVGVQMLREARLPYIVVLTNPTTGGVTASYAMLGDVQIAEPGALIGFAGARVIEQTIREKLPEGFQRAEYLKDHGMVDMVVHRHEMRPTLARLCRLLTKSPAIEAAPKADAVVERSPDRLRGGRRAGRASRVNAPAATASPPLARVDRAAVGAASPRYRSRPRADASAAGAARSSRTQVAAGDPCRRHQWQGFDDRLSARDPGGGRPARPCLHLALSGADQRMLSARPPVAACWSATTNCARRSNIASASMTASRSPSLKSKPRRRSACSRNILPMCVLLEVGLGGRLDATNVIETPLACVITPISMDHTEFLGDTLTQIAGEKAGIIKRKRAGDLRRAGAGGDGGDRSAGEPHARAAACCGAGMACQCRARPAGLSGRSRPDGSRRAAAVRAASVRQCRACDRDVARASTRSGSASRRSRPASSTPNGRRGCSGWPRARWWIWRRRAARSGSTADTMPKAAASRRRRWAISRSGCRGRWW